jgi:hypothetical protein
MVYFELEAEALESGITRRTLRRASDHGIDRRKDSQSGRWIWRLEVSNMAKATQP